MSLTRAQVDALLRPINPRRVLRDNKGMAHVSQQDVRAHLTRVFGFGGWSSEVADLTLVREAPGKDNKTGQDKGWAVTYRATVRLTVRDPHGTPVAVYEDVATGTSPNLPTLGDAHDFACKVAVSMALKRAATNLGDGFGLSLYNKGQISPLVIATLVVPDGDAIGHDVDRDVPEQVSFGHDDAGSQQEHDQLVSDLTASEPGRVERVKKAKRDKSPPEPDQWSTSDPAFVQEWREALAAATDPDALAALGADLNAAVATMQVTDADFEALVAEGKARREAVEAAPGPGQVDLLTGEVQEPEGGWPEVAQVPGEPGGPILWGGGAG